ncbi:hypothetical protein D9M71_489680 [compost metagenome]
MIDPPAQAYRQRLRQLGQGLQPMPHQQRRRGLLHFHIGMGTGPEARRLTVEQLEQPTGLTELRTDTQHANGRCHWLGRTAHGPQQVRGRGFTDLLDGQRACGVALAAALHLAGPVETVETHHHLRVISLGAGFGPGFEHLAQGLVALVIRVDQHVPFDGRQVGGKLTRRGLAPLRLEVVEKAVEFSECAGLHQFADYLARAGERLHGAIPQVHLREAAVPSHGNRRCPTTLSHTWSLRKVHWIRFCRAV